MENASEDVEKAAGHESYKKTTDDRVKIRWIEIMHYDWISN